MFTLIALFAGVLLAAPSDGFKSSDINTLISFGDSYTTRNINLSNLTYQCRDCTSAGGPNWVTYLTEAEEWISWDFAIGGAPLNDTLVHKDPSIIDVAGQIQDIYPSVFVSPSKKIAKIVQSAYTKGPRTSRSTLNSIWVGINDIGLTYGWRNTDQVDATIMQQYKSLIKELIAYGETRFMLMNVPPIERSPMWTNTTVMSKSIKKHVKAFNNRLSKMTKDLKKEYSNSTFIVYDTWSFFTRVLDHPDKFDIKYTQKYCPDWSTPEKYHCQPMQQ
ncbi:hypothetical protein RMATCC62417_04854 [Rhizopus microsporus]|nr:hypothetical protein RMATCC62417_04854 [Rhizopus microsporus]